MQIQIKQTDGSLPVIEDLGGFGIGQLEGYNGVGKTLTVSIVELCSGRRPPLDTAAWQGLCEGIGHLEVAATELHGAEELRWVLNGDQLWRVTRELSTVARPELNWFVDVTIDGAPAPSFAHVSAIFAVERVNGDVGLVEQLAGIADSAVRDLEGYRDGLYGSEKLGQVEQHVGALRGMLDELVVDRVADRAALVNDLQQERDSAERVATEAAAWRDRLHEAVRLHSRLEEIAVGGAELDEQISTLDDEITTLTSERKIVLADLETAEAAASQSEEVQRELNKAARAYKSANTRVRNITRDLATDSQIAGVVDEDEDLKDRRDELERQLAGLRRARIEIDAGPSVVALIDRVQPPLGDAARAGLGDEPLLSAPARAHDQWTVNEVAAGLLQRRDELAEQPRPNEAAELDEQVDAATSQLAALGRVERRRAELVKAMERRTDAAKRSHELTEQLDKATTARLDELRGRREALDDRLSHLGGERAVLVFRRDSLGAPQQRDALAVALKDHLAELGIDEATLQDAYVAGLRAAEHERDALVDIVARYRVALGDHERDMADISRLITDLHNSAGVAWMGGGTVGVPVLDQSLDEQLAGITRLQRAAASADERLTGVRGLILEVMASTEAVADELRNRPVRAQVRLDAVRGWLERYAANWFADEDFRKALLGEGAEEVAVDLRTRQVVWLDADAQRRSKPIEALSSGERAFAFTQARLALLERRAGTAANRLIALDEFGAFVARNRVRQLADYLASWRSTHRSDQFLLILPASQDYTALARASDGDDATRYERMAQKLHDQQWFVEEFQAL